MSTPAPQQGPIAQDLIGAGYLPKELPIEFTSAPLSQVYEAVLGAWSSKTKPPRALPETFNLARRDHARRMLSIPNPVHFADLARIIEANWTSINAKCSASSISVSKPVFGSTGKTGRNRATNPAPSHELSELRLISVAPYRYVLQTDFTRFFASIYTHSIPWALHSKSTAKTQRSAALFGNALDTSIRNAQDGQTVGIPVGPDTSHIISEIIASAIDERITPAPLSGYRFVDDYFLCYERESDAIEALESLANAAHEFELELNYEKTSIRRVEDLSDSIGLDALRDFEFSSEDAVSRTELHAFFAVASDLYKRNENAFKYAIRILARRNIDYSLWPLFESYLLRSVTISASCLDVVAFTFYRHCQQHAPIDVQRVAHYLSGVVTRGLTYNRHSDVVWALWIFKILRLSVPADVTAALSLSSSSVVSLLALDLRQMGLLAGVLDTAPYVKRLSKGSLYGSDWLLAYESAHKGWLTPKTALLQNDPFFSVMHSNGVTFYEPNALPDLAAKAATLSAREIRDLNAGSLQHFLLNAKDIKQQEPPRTITPLRELVVVKTDVRATEEHAPSEYGGEEYEGEEYEGEEYEGEEYEGEEYEVEEREGEEYEDEEYEDDESEDEESEDDEYSYYY